MSRCSERSVASATEPTRASDGVRSPPVSSTVRSRRGTRWSTSETRTELVTTVRLGMSTRWKASCQVVVPAVIPIALPAATIDAAAMAMACFSAMLRRDLASNPGSSLLCSSRTVAPPWTLVSSPASSSDSRSRRMVMSLTPSSAESSLTRTAPRRRTSATMTSWRWRASAGAARASTGGPGHDA